MSEVLGQELKSFLSLQSMKEKIEVLEKQISVVSRRALQCETEEQREQYKGAQKKLETELDNLVFPN
jgi:hypothetical protein